MCFPLFSFLCVTCRPSDKEFKANVEALTTCMSVGKAKWQLTRVL